jgi:sulfur transfer complex TusBCD TusB component (DsrH family)
LRKVLYILGKPQAPNPPLPAGSGSDSRSSVVLIQEAVTLSQVPGDDVFALGEDLAARQATSRFPVISYADLLRMIFEADSVVAL